MEKIKFSIPGLYQFTKINLFLVELMENYPNMFRDNIEIESMYGCFPCVWNGGRLTEGVFQYDDIMTAVVYLNSKGIKARYTFTNMLIDEDVTKDTLGNAILKITQEYQMMQNDVIIANDCMKKYIEENYPDFSISYSTTLMISDVNKLNEISSKYMIVPDYSINNKFDKLSKLEHPENIELLVNEVCRDTCPRRHEHYMNNSLVSLYRQNNNYHCTETNEENYFEVIKKREHHISFEDIEKKYLPLGINHFKLAGRSSNILNLIESYVDYFVKDEHKTFIRWELVDYVLKNS